RFSLANLQIVKTNKNTCDHPCKFPANRRKHSFVEIADVEIHEPVVSFIASKVFKVQISGNPAGRGRRERIVLTQVFIKQMTGAAEEPKGIFRHAFIFDFEEK